MAPLFLNMSLDGSEWPASRPGRCTTGNEFWYPLNRRLIGPQNQSRRFGEEENLLSLPMFEPRPVQPVASHCTNSNLKWICLEQDTCQWWTAVIFRFP